MNDLVISVIRSARELAEALRVRTLVFVEEQGVPLAEEVDGYDADPASNARAVHVIARLAGVPVATARLQVDAHPGEYAHIGRVAVLAEHRGRHIGEAMMRALHDAAQQRGFRGVAISAQVDAVAFYERLGYVAEGPVYLEAGIEHRAMSLRFEG